MSNIIDSIQVSGTVYQIQGSGGNPTVELTQAEYDALVSAGTVSPTTYYIITDATPIDVSNYYTKSETSGSTQISTALNGKQNTLIAGDNITISGNVISASGGGSSVNVVQTTGTSTTDVMSQDAVTTQLNDKANKSAAVGGYQLGSDNYGVYLRYRSVSSINIGNPIYYTTINGKGILTSNSSWAKNNLVFQLVETSAITSSVTSASTDSEIPSAKAVYDAIGQGGGEVSSAITSGDTNAVAGGAVYDRFDEVEQVTAAALNALNNNFGGLKLVKLTQAEYTALTTKDSNTLYVIV